MCIHDTLVYQKLNYHLSKSILKNKNYQITKQVEASQVAQFAPYPLVASLLGTHQLSGFFKYSPFYFSNWIKLLLAVHARHVILSKAKWSAEQVYLKNKNYQITKQVEASQVAQFAPYPLITSLQGTHQLSKFFIFIF